MQTLFDPSRREWLNVSLGSLLGAASTACLPGLAAVAANPERKKSIIVLWLNGGPATIDLWDLKPGHENGGPFQEIATAAPGVRISEHLPQLAQSMQDLAIVRSMATREGDHGRASYLATTGYIPQGALQFPALGSLVSKELADESLDLPGYVSVSPRRNQNLGGGFLGPRYSPLVVGDRDRSREPAASAESIRVPDLTRPRSISDATYADRLDLLAELEREFHAGKDSPVVDSMQSAVARAVRLMRPEAAGAFRLEDEDPKLLERYGRGNFGQGCLLARRLVERGVSFVEVALDGWDTHQANFDRVKSLSAALDAGFATLLADLKQRGLLDSTLVLCFGEFGRTPRINGNAGRDHWPQSWASVLAGGGIKGGQVIGKTSADGAAVDDHPVNIPDLVATACRAVGIDPMKQNISNVSRPIRIADPTAKPIVELL
jgi:hypothetical protein